MRRVDGYAICIMIVAVLAGCIDDEPGPGPLRLNLVSWEVEPDGHDTARIITRLTNVGDNPIWRIRVFGDTYRYSVDGYREDAALVSEASSNLTLPRPNEALAPRSYIEWASYAEFDDPPLKYEIGPRAGSYLIIYHSEYGTENRSFDGVHTTCNIPIAQEERTNWDCVGADKAFPRERASAPPENMTLVGTPIPGGDAGGKA